MNEIRVFKNCPNTLAYPEIKQASSASVQFLRLRRLESDEIEETEESESKAISVSESKVFVVLVLKRRTCNFLGLGVYQEEVGLLFKFTSGFIMIYVEAGVNYDVFAVSHAVKGGGGSSHYCARSYLEYYQGQKYRHYHIW